MAAGSKVQHLCSQTNIGRWGHQPNENDHVGNTAAQPLKPPPRRHKPDTMNSIAQRTEPQGKPDRIIVDNQQFQLNEFPRTPPFSAWLSCSSRTLVGCITSLNSTSTGTARDGERGTCPGRTRTPPFHVGNAFRRKPCWASLILPQPVLLRRSVKRRSWAA